MSIWDTYDQGVESGQREGGRIRNARAFQSGGLDGVADAAGRTGDLDVMEGARMMQRRQRQFENEEQEQAFGWFEKNAPFARGALRRAQQLPPEQRGAFLNAPHIRQRFEQMGFSAEQIDNAIAGLSSPEIDQATGQPVSETWFGNLDSAFRQHEDPNWTITNPITGEIGAIDPEGEYMRGGQAPALGQEWEDVPVDEMTQLGYRGGVPGQRNRRTGEIRQRQNPPGVGRGGGAGASGYPDDGYDYEAE